MWEPRSGSFQGWREKLSSEPATLVESVAVTATLSWVSLPDDLSWTRWGLLQNELDLRNCPGTRFYPSTTWGGSPRYLPHFLICPASSGLSHSLWEPLWLCHPKIPGQVGCDLTPFLLWSQNLLSLLPTLKFASITLTSCSWDVPGTLPAEGLCKNCHFDQGKCSLRCPLHHLFPFFSQRLHLNEACSYLLM